jgi:hypothetical protein
MQKNVTYHSSAILYNEMLAEGAREAAEKVEHPVVKGWCTGIANQHDFHAERHRRALEKLKNASDTSTTVEAAVPATTSMEASMPVSTEVEVDHGLNKEH